MKKEPQKKPSGKAKLTLPNIKGFLQGNYRKIKEEILGLPLPSYQKDQIEDRVLKVLENSPECLQKEECYCGCSMPEKLYEDRGCEGWEEGGKLKPCYPDMLSEAEWKKLKTENNGSSK